MMSNDYNLRAAKGQAFNLAVHQAISEGKAGDNKFIFSAYTRFYNLGQLLQSGTVDDIKEIMSE